MRMLTWARDTCGLAAGAVLVASLLAGCGSGRDVEVKGEVTSPSSALQGKLHVDFIDVMDDEQEIVHSVELDELGAFSETVSLEGDRTIVRAIDDADGDGACTAGEAWAQAEAEIGDDDTAGPVTLALTTASCPAGE